MEAPEPPLLAQGEVQVPITLTLGRVWDSEYINGWFQKSFLNLLSFKSLTPGLG